MVNFWKMEIFLKIYNVLLKSRQKLLLTSRNTLECKLMKSIIELTRNICSSVWQKMRGANSVIDKATVSEFENLLTNIQINKISHILLCSFIKIQITLK